jgi:hypothetical protein
LAELQIGTLPRGTEATLAQAEWFLSIRKTTIAEFFALRWLPEMGAYVVGLLARVFFDSFIGALSGIFSGRLLGGLSEALGIPMLL